MVADDPVTISKRGKGFGWLLFVAVVVILTRGNRKQKATNTSAMASPLFFALFAILAYGLFHGGCVPFFFYDGDVTLYDNGGILL